jgi:hypothetical protein
MSQSTMPSLSTTRLHLLLPIQLTHLLHSLLPAAFTARCGKPSILDLICLQLL